ncbi:MAG: hypothetical protein IBX36_03565 [Dehalococcoidia bacterium]|nr:hypothetical protein [Dehalococcoidia bacterium]
MRFLRFSMFDVAKAGDVSEASDKVWKSPPPGVKMLARHICLGIPFPGFPLNTMLSVDLIEAESTEALLAVTYPQALAGASVWYVPVIELPMAEVGKLEWEQRGRTR